MTLFDLLIVAVILISAASAFYHGLLVELFSLGGVIVGFMVAAADYGLMAPWLMGWVKNPEAADVGAFLAIALGIMLTAGLLGRLLRGTARWAGLGFVDRLLGAVFGLAKGCVVVTLAVMAIAAFLPSAAWLRNSRIVPPFLAAAHEGSRLTPELGGKIREGIRRLRIAQPQA